MICEHINASKIHTYEGAEMKIIDTNYQCNKCGEILTQDEYQNILTGSCTNCGGQGYWFDGHTNYKCPCILDED